MQGTPLLPGIGCTAATLCCTCMCLCRFGCMMLRYGEATSADGGCGSNKARAKRLMAVVPSELPDECRAQAGNARRRGKWSIVVTLPASCRILKHDDQATVAWLPCGGHVKGSSEPADHRWWVAWLQVAYAASRFAPWKGCS